MNKIKDIPTEVKQQAIAKGIHAYKGGLVNIYGIKDVKMGFVEIMIGRADGAMVRNLQTAITNKQTQIGQFPEDFELWCLGTMGELTGEISSEPRFIVKASDLKSE